MITTAREFIEEIAETLRTKGRTVEITETQESFGIFVWLYSPAPHWYDRTISLNARHSNRTGRWALGKLSVGSSVSGTKQFERTTRTAIRIAAEVYA